MKRKEEIYNAIQKYTSEINSDSIIKGEDVGLDATTVALQLGMTRNNVSKEMNALEREGKIIRVKSKPALFLDLFSLEEMLNKKLSGKNRNIKYIQNEFERKFNNHNNELNISKLDLLIGANGSLSTQVEEAKAAIIYPPFGLHTFLVGETGVGKTMFAECMYNYGVMKGRFKEDAPYVAFNCADYAENTQLLLAQLFGYVKGAFTGADSDKEGIIQKANHGLLLLDEVHRLPPEGQEMLFYFLDNGGYRRLGETNVFHKAEILVVAATTEKIDSSILRTFSRRIPMMIKMPSLEERTLDERLNLIKHFFYKEAEKINMPIKVSGEVMHVLLLYKCTGNIGQLQSDIKLICAKAFLNSKENLESEIYIKYELLTNQIKQNLIQQDYLEKLKNINQHNLFLKSYFTFDNESNSEVLEQLINSKINMFINSINKICADSLNGYDVNQKKSIYREMGNLVNGFWRDLQDSIYNFQDLFYRKVSGTIIFSVMNLYKNIIMQKREYKLTQKILVIICLLIDYASKNDIKNIFHNLAKNQIGNNNDYAIIDNAIEELEASLAFASKVKEYIYILLLIDIKRNPLLQEKAIKDRCTEVIVICHGISTAGSMLNLAQSLLNIESGYAIDIVDYENYLETAEKTINLLNEIDRESDILLMMDFANLAALGEYVIHKTGRTIKIITNITSQMVVEALNNAYLAFFPLDKLEESLQSITPGKTLCNYKDIKKEQLILVTCVSGYGTARKIADWVGSMEIIKNTDIGIMPIGEFEFDIIEDRKILAVIGTIDVGIMDVPYISLEELILGTGIAKLVDIIKGGAAHDNSIIIEEDIEEITLAALNRLLEFCDAKKLFKLLDVVIKNIIENPEKNEKNLYLRFITHTACMVERLIKNIILVHSKSKSVLKKYEKTYTSLRNNMAALEETYGIRIPEEEYAYIVEMLNDKK